MAILNFVKKRMFRSGETLGLFTSNKEEHSERFLKCSSALYYFFSISKPKIPGLFIFQLVYDEPCRVGLVDPHDVVIYFTYWGKMSHEWG